MIVSRCSRRLGHRLPFSAPFRQHVANFSLLAEENIQVVNVRREGDNVDDNYSLLVDRVVNAKNAYRNSRVSTVVNKLPAKIENGKLALKDVQFYGTEVVQEAGDSISHEDFKNSLEATRNYLSSGRDLFLEDVGIGASSSLRLGTRVISDNPAHAFIFRSLLINIPPRVSRHLERFHGWNMDSQDDEQYDKTWTGSSYEFVPANETPKKGERPIVAYVGGDNNTIGVQFEQLPSNNSAIAGANIIAGGKASIRGIVNALTLAASAMINLENPEVIALPSLAITKNGATTLIVGNVSDNLIAKAVSSGTLYGPYSNVVSSNGTSAMFNGAIIPASLQIPSAPFAGFSARESFPAVVSNDATVRIVNPDNYTFKPTTIVFVGSEASITLEDAVTKFVQVSGDESKADVARAILSSAKIVAIKSENDAYPFVG